MKNPNLAGIGERKTAGVTAAGTTATITFPSLPAGYKILSWRMASSVADEVIQATVEVDGQQQGKQHTVVLLRGEEVPENYSVLTPGAVNLDLSGCTAATVYAVTMTYIRTGKTCGK